MIKRRYVQITGIAVLGVFFCVTNSSASVFTFDSATELTSYFNMDVISDDTDTQWKAGYAAQSGYDGSDGGFVHFNQFDTGNSLQFLDGPVTLNSFDISAQWGAGGAGVSEAIDAAKDYRLRLLDENLTPLMDTVMTVDTENGMWTTETFNLANVSVISISRRNFDGTGSFGDGWWPNIDNIVVNEAIPEPSVSILFALGFCSIGWIRRRSRN